MKIASRALQRLCMGLTGANLLSLNCAQAHNHGVALRTVNFAYSMHCCERASKVSIFTTSTGFTFPFEIRRKILRRFHFWGGCPSPKAGRTGNSSYNVLAMGACCGRARNSYLDMTGPALYLFYFILFLALRFSGAKTGTRILRKGDYY